MSSIEYERVKLIWEIDRLRCNAHFNDLFDNAIEFMPSQRVSPSVNMEVKSLSDHFIEYDSQYHIKTWIELYFYDIQTLSYYDRKLLFHKIASSLVPNKIVRHLVQEYYNTMNEDTYGIHIRRGIGYNYNSSSSLKSPTKLFVDKMHEVLYNEPEASFFVATDAQHEVDYLKYLFGDKIITIDKPRMFPLDSGYTYKGMLRSVADLYLLSKTRKIFGGAGSSYSEFASLLGNIEVETLIDNEVVEYFNRINEGKYNPTW